MANVWLIPECLSVNEILHQNAIYLCVWQIPQTKYAHGFLLSLGAFRSFIDDTQNLWCIYYTTCLSRCPYITVWGKRWHTRLLLPSSQEPLYWGCHEDLCAVRGWWERWRRYDWSAVSTSLEALHPTTCHMLPNTLAATF